MRECENCLTNIYDNDLISCPVCGFALPLNIRTELSSIQEKRAEDYIPLDEELKRFKKQFEDKAIDIPPEILLKAKGILSSAESEIRRCSILIIDLCGYTKMSKELSAETVAAIVKNFYTICIDCIIRRGGFVVKFIGDAVLAIFGAPLAYDRDTESAALTAIDLRDYFSRTDEFDTPLTVSIGIATGEVKSGQIETQTGKNYDVIGEAVNLASRLQAQAQINEILICGETYNVVKRSFDCQPTPPLILKNISDFYVAYKVVEEREDKVPLRSFDTPFCGRDGEIKALKDFLLDKSSAAVKVAHIEGEAGIGKSRFVFEVINQNSRDKRVIWWEGSPFETLILFSPVIKWLCSEIGISKTDNVEILKKVINHYIKNSPHLQDYDPALLEYIFGAPEAIVALQSMPPEIIQKNLFCMIRQIILKSESAHSQKDIIVVVDDFQWMDLMTVRFLNYLINFPGRNGISVLLLYRPEDKLHILPAQDHLVIRLESLPDKERQNLLSKLVPAEEFLPEIRKYIFSRAAGNPLFIEEITKLIKTVVRNNSGLNDKNLTNHIIEILPLSLRDLIQSRIDKLEIQIKKVLQCASLLGLEFTFSLIDMFEIIKDGLDDHLNALKAMKYLNEIPKSAKKDFHYFFTHGLFRDVAYSTLLEEQKRTLHIGLACRMEQTFKDRIHEYYELLAYHFSKGGETQKSIYYLVKAGDRQTGLGEPKVALKNYEQAIELLQSLPATTPRQVLLARVLTRCGRLHRILGNHDDSTEMLEGAIRCAELMNNERLLLEAKLESAVSEVWRGETDKAAQTLEGIITDARRLESPAAEAVALNSLGVIHLHKANYEKALATFQRLAKLSEENKTPQVEADAFNNAGLIYWRWGQLPQGIKAFKKAIGLRRAACDKFGLATTIMNLGIIYEQIGKTGAAKKAYLSAMQIAQKTGYTQLLAALESNLCNIERKTGTLAASLEHGVKGLEFAKLSKDPRLEAAVLENLGLAYTAAGDFANAEKSLSEALKITIGNKSAEQEQNVRLSFLEYLLRCGEVREECIFEINEILKKIEADNFPDLIPRAYRIKGKILNILNENNSKTAREYFSMALDISRNRGDMFEEIECLKYFIDFAAEKNLWECKSKYEGELNKVLHIIKNNNG